MSTRNGSRTTAGALALLAAAVAVASPVSAADDDDAKFRSGDTYVLRSDQTRVGDLYVVAKASLDVAGVLEGDLFGLSAEVSVGGDVRGDTLVGGSIVDLSGTFGDSCRVFASNFRLDGTIHGDLIVVGANVVLGEDSRVTGDVYVGAGTLRAAGRIEGDLGFGGGELRLTGSVGRNVDVRSDRTEIGPLARIGGDLAYVAREEAEIPDGVVAGTVDYEPRRKDDEEGGGRAFLTSGDLTGKLLQMVWAFVLGCVAIGLFRRPSDAVVRSVGREPFLKLGIGFVLLFVVPISSVVAMVLIVTVPLSLAVLALYVVVAYLAKLPVAAFVGRAILRRVGSPEPSPYVGLLVGLVPLYGLFLVLFAWSTLAGFALWAVVSMVGLGAIASGLRERTGAAGASPGGGPAPDEA